jgi:hypothetical protein
VRVTARRISLFALVLGAVALGLGCQIIAGIDDISLVPGDAGGHSNQDSGAPPGNDALMDSMATPLSDGSTAPWPDQDAATGDEIPPSGADDSTLTDAPALPEADASPEAAALVDASTDAPLRDAGGGACKPLSRSAWLTNPGTTASDDKCGIINLFDDALTTRWSTGRTQMASPAQWLEIDLGCAQTFSRIFLDAANDLNDYPRTYTVVVSNDNVTWTQVAGGSGSSVVTTIDFASTTARYVKINQTGIAPSNFWSIDELNVCGTTNGSCPGAPTAYGRKGWATNPGTTASDTISDIGRMFDGTSTTRWSTGRPQTTSPPEWVEIDMGASQPFSRVILQNYLSCDDYPRAYALQVSTDNTNWTPLAAASGSTPVTAIAFPSTTARYIKLTQTGMTPVFYWSIDELDVYR